MTFTPHTDLPIAGALRALTAALMSRSSAVLVAEPGAGKTTIVPLVLLDQPWCVGRVIVVEPRRVAARAAATRLAALVGERPGVTVGWRMRGDTKVGAATRIEVVTDGVFTRIVQNDPSLDGIACVVFDEFHERSLDVDLGLALCIDAQLALRPELRILVMSATMDASAVANLLDDAPVISSPGRSFEVMTRHVGAAALTFQARDVADTTRQALRETTGDVLVFLPGAREIRAVERALEPTDAIEVRPLYGSLGATAQQQALDPATPGKRKIVLATNIAETSLTIEGVTAVVDSGWVRRSNFDVSRGIAGLVTTRVSRAAADQRRGRAGRVGPGTAYRLWSEAEHALLEPYDRPEIVQADLIALALDLARWGNAAGDRLRWLNPPPAHALAAATGVLVDLGLINSTGHVTTIGHAVAALPVHPRLGRAVLAARDRGFGALGCVVAALLSDRDVGEDRRDADLAQRIDQVSGTSSRPEVDRVRREAQRLRRAAHVDDDTLDLRHLGTVLALAYPDRIGQRRDTAGRYLLASGSGAALDARDNLASSEWLAVADVEWNSDGGGDARILLAAPISRDEVERVVVPTTELRATWDRRAHDVRVQRETRIGAIVLKAIPVNDRAAAQRALLDGVRIEGLSLLPRLDAATALRARVAFCRAHDRNDEQNQHGGDDDESTWPDLGDDTLTATLDAWLAPELVRVDAQRRVDLARVDVVSAIGALIGWRSLARLDRFAPTFVTTAKLTRRSVDYTGAQPMVTVRLQDALGWADTPRVGEGRVPVTVTLLSPANRPVQVTSDLAGFWRGSYAQVRADMRGRYPKHFWPAQPPVISDTPM